MAGRDNPYQLLMMRGLRRGLPVAVYHGRDGKLFPFTRTTAAYRPALIHVDWVHQYLYRRRTAWTYVQHALFLVDVAVARILGARFAWTVHNVMPHGRDRPGRLRAWFAKTCELLRVFDPESEDAVVAAFGVSPDAVAVVPEGSYVDYYPPALPRIPAPTRQLLYVGNIRPYKNTLELIESFRRVTPGGWTLKIRGRAFDEAYAQRCAAAAAGDPAIDIDASFVAEEDLPELFARASLVCLPFGKINNSGSVILAMGYRKPIVAPAAGAVAERLSGQPELLFTANRPLDDALSRALRMEDDELDRLGQANFEALDRFRWVDFAPRIAEVINDRSVA